MPFKAIIPIAITALVTTCSSSSINNGGGLSNNLLRREAPQVVSSVSQDDLQAAGDNLDLADMEAFLNSTPGAGDAPLKETEDLQAMIDKELQKLNLSSTASPDGNLADGQLEGGGALRESSSPDLADAAEPAPAPASAVSAKAAAAPAPCPCPCPAPCPAPCKGGKGRGAAASLDGLDDAAVAEIAKENNMDVASLKKLLQDSDAAADTAGQSEPEFK